MNTCFKTSAKRQLAFLGLAFAAASSVAAVFSGTITTVGPDLYADGTPVPEGERYGFVYVPNGQSLGGFFSDGTLRTPDKNQLLPKTLTADSGSRVRRSVSFGAEYANGTMYAVLFDTRKPDGTIGGVTNGWGVVGYAKLGPAPQSFNTTISFTPVNTYEEDGMEMPYAKVTDSAPLPPSALTGIRITKIDFSGAEVILTVDGSASCAYYLVASAGELGGSSGFVRREKSQAVRGSDNPAQPLVLRCPKSDGRRFFKVVGGTLMDL